MYSVKVTVVSERDLSCTGYRTLSISCFVQISKDLVPSPKSFEMFYNISWWSFVSSLPRHKISWHLLSAFRDFLVNIFPILFVPVKVIFICNFRTQHLRWWETHVNWKTLSLIQIVEMLVNLSCYFSLFSLLLLSILSCFLHMFVIFILTICEFCHSPTHSGSCTCTSRWHRVAKFHQV